MPTEKTPNYTPEMEAIIRAAAPLNLAKAKEVGEKIGKSYQSVIAKALSLGVDYETKKPEKKRVIQTTKSELVDELAEYFGDDVNLKGLEKATAASLRSLMEAVGNLNRLIQAR